MEIAEYRKMFMDQLHADALLQGMSDEEQFAETALGILEDTDEVRDPVQASVEIRGRRGRIMAFDAYAYDDADSALVMIASDFNWGADTPRTLTNTRIDELYGRMRAFVEESVEGKMTEWCDDSDPAIGIAREISGKVGQADKGRLTWEVMRFRFLIISNCELSKQVKNLSKEDLMGRPVEVSVWTLERFFEAYTSNSSELIEVDVEEFGCNGIQCLKADIGQDADYDAYLGIVPGSFLAQLYLKHGSKLLQRNVRAFLNVRGKVNKGIRETIMNHPQNFFTYNNGIAVVARSVRFSADGTRITHLTDPQIINGGQTTASLANAVIRKERVLNAMGSLYVPMKLTVLNVGREMSEEEEERNNEMSKRISQCANSQNAVSDADFFSNHPFHVLMETLSRKTMAPAVGGNVYPTVWYYERSRGKWEQEQMKLTQAKRKEFWMKSPKNQVLKKVKLAKCRNAFAMHPHEVCQSSAINFKRFSQVIEDIYDKQRESINEEYFKRCVCCVIVFDELDRLVNRSKWYPQGGNKAQIVPYAIAKMVSLLPKGKDLNWAAIWRKQTMPADMAREMERIARLMHEFLLDEANGGIVRSISRSVAVWNKCRELNVRLSQDFLASLVSSDETKTAEQSARRAAKFNINVDNSVEVFKLGADYWTKVAAQAERDGVLPYGDLSFISGIASYIKRGNLPTDAQCRKLSRIISRMESKGFVMPLA